MEPTLTEFVMERKGCPLHYWVGGPQGQPLVVFTHGACVDHHSFDPHVPVVAQRYRVLSWDVRGHGSVTLIRDDLKPVRYQAGEGVRL